MPQCRKCGKKGLFLKIEEDTCLCLSCKYSFAQKGNILTEMIIDAKNTASVAKDPAEITKFCQMVEDNGTELLALHQAYNLQPSQELLDLIDAHKKMRVAAKKELRTKA